MSSMAARKVPVVGITRQCVCVQHELAARRAGIGGVDRDPRQVSGAQRAALMSHPQALGQQQVELVAQSPAPVAEVGALVREDVLEELFTGEVLEVRIVDPALADTFVGWPEHVLEQEQSDHEAACVHIPTKPAGYPEVMSATHSNLIAATVPISSRPGDAVSSGRFW